MLDLNVKFKTLPHFQGPIEYATDGSAALDLRSPRDIILHPQGIEKLKLGLCLDMTTVPVNMAALIIPRSGLGTLGLEIRNTIGLIDQDYLGEIKCTLRHENFEDEFNVPIHINKGDRFCQLFFVPIFKPSLTHVEEFDVETERGEDGFGSTGVK